MDRTILGIDIGSTKICAVIAEISDDGIPHIIGVGIHKAEGVRKGLITNIEQAATAIRNVVNDAKVVSGEQIDKAIISLSGAYTKSIRESAIVHVSNNDKIIGINEISRVMQAVIYNASIPDDHILIHALPYEFRLDGQSYVEDPMGMSASRLEVSACIVTAKKTTLENLKRAASEAGIEIKNIVLSAYASSLAVLSDEEKELGVACIDMGGQTCDLMIYSGHSMRYCDFLSVGSNNITIDLATALNTHPSKAEDFKIRYGNLILSDEDKTKSVQVPTITGEYAKDPISLEIVHGVIKARVEETLQLLAKSIVKSGLKDKIGAGITLTGGMANLNGMQEFASSIFLPKSVRISKPIAVDGLFDRLKGTDGATVVGLILHGAGRHTSYEMNYNKVILYKKSGITTNNANVHNLELSKNAIKEPTFSSRITQKDDLLEIRTSKDDKDNNLLVRLWKWISNLF